MVLENTRTLTSSLHTHMCTHMPIHAHTHTLALFSLKTTLLFRNVLQWLLESWKTFCPNTHCCIFMVKFPSQHTKDQVNIQHTRPLFSAKTKKWVTARKPGVILSSQRPVQHKLEGYAEPQRKYLKNWQAFTCLKQTETQISVSTYNVKHWTFTWAGLYADPLSAGMPLRQKPAVIAHTEWPLVLRMTLLGKAEKLSISMTMGQKELASVLVHLNVRCQQDTRPGDPAWCRQLSWTGVQVLLLHSPTPIPVCFLHISARPVFLYSPSRP